MRAVVREPVSPWPDSCPHIAQSSTKSALLGGYALKPGVGLFLPNHHMGGVWRPHMFGTFVSEVDQVHAVENSFP